MCEKLEMSNSRCAGAMNERIIKIIKTKTEHRGILSVISTTYININNIQHTYILINKLKKKLKTDLAPSKQYVNNRKSDDVNCA